MFSPYTVAASTLNPGDLIRYTNPLYKEGSYGYPVFQGVVVSVKVERTAGGKVKMGTLAQVNVLLPLTNAIASYMFPWDQYLDVVGQISQEALDYMKDFRKFQP